MRTQTPEQAGEARRAGIERRRLREIDRLALSLDGEQRAQYEAWLRLSRKMGTPTDPQSRRDYLSDLKEMPQ